jgi:hypothetical protein
VVLIVPALGAAIVLTTLTLNPYSQPSTLTLSVMDFNSTKKKLENAVNPRKTHDALSLKSNDRSGLLFLSPTRPDPTRPLPRLMFCLWLYFPFVYPSLSSMNKSEAEKLEVLS